MSLENILVTISDNIIKKIFFQIFAFEAFIGSQGLIGGGQTPPHPPVFRPLLWTQLDKPTTNHSKEMGDAALSDKNIASFISEKL